MTWLICLFIVGSMVYLITPQNAADHTQRAMLGLSAISQPKLLMLLPLVILVWLAIKAFAMPFSFYTLAAVSFVTTSIVLLVPRWRIAILPCAFLSLFSALLGVVWG
ncbi:hypothetical protein JYB87_13980 [Shewanella avicenniae]|uniref:DUF3325 domain-containing protein n=1 Tax=Shewanella avicenniae TaxID=2814294 RepID=A0ABX7QNA5_9GAMM|nr:hypothetical protein [Shewanella avicenniae]QSX32844.1 hypothetical protein JYB87_13980 [Shewanella avicenniae]